MTEPIAFAFGVTGTLLLALKGKHAGWGFVAFLGSNVAWMVFAAANRHWWLLAQHAVFMATSALGIYTWLLQRRVKLFRKHYRISRGYATRWEAFRTAYSFARLLG
jgi:hypothetical protein